MLAEGMPKVSADGKVYSIALRKGVKLHSGRELDAEDVVASLKRWMEVSPRGKSVGAQVETLAAKGPLTVEIVLKNAYAPLLAQLAMPSGMAAIMAKESLAQPLKEYVGTGPYQFKERKPDQYVLLTRFDGYSARTEPANGYGGKRTAVADELRFVPVPNANTRVEGALAGQFHYADLLPIEAFGRLEKAPGKVVPLLTPSFGFPYLVFNTKEGSMTQQAVRKAAQAALGEGEMLAAGFGDTRFFIVEGNHFPKGTPFYSDAGTASYNERDAKKAKTQAEQAGYKGETVRILTSRQYDFHYNMAPDHGRAAQACRLQGRAQRGGMGHAAAAPRRPEAVGHLHHALGLVSRADALAAAAGRWRAGLVELAGQDAGAGRAEPGAQPRQARAAVGQGAAEVVYDEVPYIQVGKFASLSARSPSLEGYTPHTYPFFWNAGLKN